MLDAEKLLSGLIGAGLGRRGLEIPGLDAKDTKLPGIGRNSSKAALGMGLLGIAVAAFEHYTGDDRKASVDKPGSTPQVDTNPPPQPPPASSPAVAPPPPPPGQAAFHEETSFENNSKQSEARLYLRAMISDATR